MNRSRCPSRIPYIQFLILLVGFANVAFASWPFSYHTWRDSRGVESSAEKPDVSHCQDAREVIEDYCHNQESKRDVRVVDALMSCFMKEAGREGVSTTESGDGELRGAELAVKDDVLRFVDGLCEESSSNHLSNIFTWLNGDMDMSKVVNSLYEAVEKVSVGGQRVQNLQQNVQTISESMAGYIRGLRDVKSAFFRANSSLFPDEEDIDRLHDELWVLMQDLVQTFNSYTSSISEASRSFKNRVKGIKSFEKVSVKVKSIAGSWRLSKDLTEKLLVEVKKNEGMRSRILYPWLSPRDEGHSLVNDLRSSKAIAKTVPRRTRKSEESSFVGKGFGSSIKRLAMLLYDSLEMISTAYLRFAFSKLVLHVIASPLSPMWVFLILTGLAHLVGGALILTRICLQIGELTSSVLKLVTKFVNYLCSSNGTQRANHIKSLEKEIIERLKDNLSEEMERVRVQQAIESVSNREINVSFKKLQSLEQRLSVVSRELEKLNERTNTQSDCD